MTRRPQRTFAWIVSSTVVSYARTIRTLTDTKGQSFTLDDAPRTLWHQSWATDRGDLLVIECKLDGDQIVLSGVDDSRGNVLVRGVWKPSAEASAKLPSSHLIMAKRGSPGSISSSNPE